MNISIEIKECDIDYIDIFVVGEIDVYIVLKVKEVFEVY